MQDELLMLVLRGRGEILPRPEQGAAMTDLHEIERLLSAWRNYKVGWISGAMMGFVAGAATMLALFAWGQP